MGEYVNQAFQVGQISSLDNRAQFAASYEAICQQRQQQANRASGTSLFEALQTFRGPAFDLPWLVELAAYGRGLLAEYQAQGVPAPDWLEPNLGLVGKAIKAAHRAALQAKLQQAERELEELKSREEKKAEKEEEVRRLREELG